jgi:hypothetical protein
MSIAGAKYHRRGLIIQRLAGGSAGTKAASKSLNHSHHMKPSMSPSVIVALLLLAAVSIAASRGGAIQLGVNRPPGVEAENWIAIGDRAGFILKSEPDSRVPVTELHVRTERGWVHTRLENPVSPIRFHP